MTDIRECPSCNRDMTYYERQGRYRCKPCRNKRDRDRSIGLPGKVRVATGGNLKKLSMGPVLQAPGGPQRKLSYIKVKLFNCEGVVYLDYIDVRFKSHSRVVRMRPAVRELDAGYFVEMVEMEGVE